MSWIKSQSAAHRLSLCPKKRIANRDGAYNYFFLSSTRAESATDCVLDRNDREFLYATNSPSSTFITIITRPMNHSMPVNSQWWSLSSKVMKVQTRNLIFAWRITIGLRSFGSANSTRCQLYVIISNRRKASEISGKRKYCQIVSKGDGTSWKINLWCQRNWISLSCYDF